MSEMLPKATDHRIRPVQHNKGDLQVSGQSPEAGARWPSLEPIRPPTRAPARNARESLTPEAGIEKSSASARQIRGTRRFPVNVWREDVPQFEMPDGVDSPVTRSG